MAYQLNWEEKGLHKVYLNKTSGREILESNFKLQGDARFDDIRYVINDFTQVAEFELTEDDINIIVSVDDVASRSNAKIKIPIVVTLPSLLEWASMYCEKMQDSPYICGIFSTMEDARVWVHE